MAEVPLWTIPSGGPVRGGRLQDQQLCNAVTMRHAFVSLSMLALFGAAAPSLDAQLVRGQVVDSITQAPVGGAAVVLLASTGAETARTTTDVEGLFLLRAPAGEYRLRAEMEGFRPSTFPPFSLPPGSMQAFMLLLPSDSPPESPATWEELATALCGEGSVAPGQGVLLGFVHEAVAEEPVSDARIVLSWGAISGRLAELVAGNDPGRLGGELTTDSSGFYVACGVPGGTQITTHAARGDLFSDFVQVRFGDGGVFAGDTFHPNRTVWHHDFKLMPPGQRSAAVAGMVLDAETTLPLAGVTVEIEETGLQATTAASGAFRLTQLPAGPVRLAVRRPGLRPISRSVELKHGETVTLPPGAFRMEAAPTELEPVTIEAEETTSRRRLADFYRRREGSSGSFMTREEWEKRGTPRYTTDILRRLRGVRVLPNNNYSFGGPRWVVVMSRGENRRGEYGGCPVLVFMDGQYLGNSDFVLLDATINVEQLEAVEAYNTVASLPAEFNRRGSECGVIVFWTR